MKEIEELRLGLETAYIDENVASNLMYKRGFHHYARSLMIC